MCTALHSSSFADPFFSCSIFYSLMKVMVLNSFFSLFIVVCWEKQNYMLKIQNRADRFLVDIQVALRCDLLTIFLSG